MDFTTAWLKPSSSKTGRDHLGVQGPCINIYGQLLPGITNVTDRARYYSFYPWFFWACDHHYDDTTWRFITSRFRRADCLFTLIAARHSRKDNEQEELHGLSMVGRNTLIPALDLLDEGKSIKLSHYATQEEDEGDRYFKNKLGGLGQYYAGPLLELGILGGGSRNGFQYTKERGKLLAEALDSSVNRDLFFRTIDEDFVTLEVLDQLVECCPCRLKFSQKEQSVLVDLFFDRHQLFGSQGKRRRNTLYLYLHLIAELQKSDIPVDHHVFRKCVYTGYLPNGARWRLPENLLGTRDSWKIFQRNELLSIALQGVFWSALSAIKNTMAEQPWFASIESFTSWFIESRYLQRVLGDRLSKDFSNFLSDAKQHIPPVQDWNNSKHEISMADEIIQRCHSHAGETIYGEIILLALGILANITLRDDASESPYGDISLPEDYLWYYPVNLHSFSRHSRKDWPEMKVSEVVAFLVGRWGIENHLRVALRKMRFDQRDTFQIRPTDGGLMWVNTPEPIYTNPRFVQGIRMLWDINMIKPTNEKQRFHLTSQGQMVLNEYIEN